MFNLTLFDWCLIKDVFWWAWKQKQDKGKWATLYYKRSVYSQSHSIICIDHDGDKGGASQLLSWQKQYTKQISLHECGSEFLLQWVMKAFSHKTHHILFISSNELDLSSSRERYSEHLQPSVKPSGHTWFWAAFKSVLGTLPKLVPSEFDPQYNIMWKPVWKRVPFFPAW